MVHPCLLMTYFLVWYWGLVRRSSDRWVLINMILTARPLSFARSQTYRKRSMMMTTTTTTMIIIITVVTKIGWRHNSDCRLSVLPQRRRYFFFLLFLLLFSFRMYVSTQTRNTPYTLCFHVIFMLLHVSPYISTTSNPYPIVVLFSLFRFPDLCILRDNFFSMLIDSLVLV
jgi:hypothetical protein